MQRCLAVTLFAISALCLAAGAADAQSALLNLPDISQHARVTQRVGLTDITIDYHGPVVHGRKIFGGIVPYGKVWRAGADYNTTIQLSTDVTIEGHPLAQGTYGLFMIPTESSWTIVFSKNSASWGAFTYDKSEDALRVNVTPRVGQPRHEALRYDFDDPTANSVGIAMQWDTVAVPFSIAVDTPAIVQRNLRDQLRGRPQFEWAPWEEAANYLLENHLDPKEALKYTENSIAVEDRFENEITKARALKALGRNDEALAAQKKAFSLGNQSQIYQFARFLQTFGEQEFPLEIFHENIQSDPNSWVAHAEQARIAVANGDFATAAAQLKLVVAVAPDAIKPSAEAILQQVQQKLDVNW